MISVPDREELQATVRRANRRGLVWIAVQIVFVGLCAGTIDWHDISSHPLLSIVAGSVLIGPTLMSQLRFSLQNKREISQLKEQTCFGEYDKHKLHTLFQDTLLRLRLPDENLPVFITNDKSLNASAIRLGLGAIFRSLNGVYLNRQLLHRLTPAEVQDIMGHELGHYYRYYLLPDRFHLLTLVLGALLGVRIGQWTGFSDFSTVLVIGFTASCFWWIDRWPWRRYGQTIEYLCDDFGAHVQGVDTSITGLLKLGIEEELHYSIHQQVLLHQRDSHQLSVQDAMLAVERAIPYGNVSRDEMAQAVERELKRQSKDQRRVTVAGFLKFAWQGDGEEAAEELLEELQEQEKRLKKIPRLDWETVMPTPLVGTLNRSQIERLIALIEAHPQHALFRLPDATGSADGIHPPLKQRILYLWRNREAIEAERRGTR